MVRIPKRYGQSRLNHCPFCSKQAVAENSQGIPVCPHHKGAELILKCRCNEFLDIHKGRWGAYCKCLNCGNMNLQRALEINPLPKAHMSDEEKKRLLNINRKRDQKEEFQTRSKDRPYKNEPQEIIISSKDIDVYFS
jgi:hypothetical protein